MKKKTISKTVFVSGLIILFFSCSSQTAYQEKFTLTNPSNFDRSSAVISISRAKLDGINGISDLSNILVKDLSDNVYLPIQWVDYDGDHTMDELLVLVNMPAQSKKTIQVFFKKNGSNLQPKTEYKTYSRFVPERIDDYTWENDKVAFRVYGPEAQRLVDEGEPGGTLSSGIDLWLKRVSYSIIDKWYAENVKKGGYYHIDHGEGFDPYHVGTSRGAGGIGIWVDDALLTSKNFTAYRTIATGPLRTIFELDYSSWSNFGVKETKRISLDLGSNFSKVEVRLSPDTIPPNYAIGITLHNNKGETAIMKEKGIVSHWEPIDDSYLGVGIILNPDVVSDAFAVQKKAADQSHLVVLSDSQKHILTYYTGFAWTKSGQVTTQQDWFSILEQQADFLAHPIIVE